ncbi:unnamed protein product [Brassicogethes aeneus]|uniref:Ell-associated factor Eaf n=1 Tax=Brassicogethes aeneus TaxID=1431903 RepID=A0A9P0FCN4_BRAAE|nr:unnamed protein product [Brassicogethes aeneus]
MADKLGIGNEVRELRIGQSFTNPKSTAFHSIRYDFKPASVDTSKKANVDVGNNRQVTITVPHLDGAGTAQTVFRGPQRPYQKECVLIIDKVTGQITIEKLSSNIQVKKTRNETKVPERIQPSESKSSSSASSMGGRSQTPTLGQRISHKTKVTSGNRRADRQITQLIPKHSPLRASPNYNSPGHHVRSPKNDPSHLVTESNPSTLASLPFINLDDFSDRPAPSGNVATNHNVQNMHKSPNFHISPEHETNNGVEEMSDSSSSSSDSDSDSDNESPPQNKIIPNVVKTNGHTNGVPTATHLLKEDLCLSESGSDSD